MVDRNFRALSSRLIFRAGAHSFLFGPHAWNWETVTRMEKGRDHVICGAAQRFGNIGFEKPQGDERADFTA